MSTQAHDPMTTGDPLTTPGRRQCTATSKRTGKRCGANPIVGGFVCKWHGGAIPAVKRKALQRVQDMLADAIDPNRVLREAGRLAYSNIQELYDDAGKLLPIKQWPENIARCVASIDQEEVTGNADKGDGKLDKIIKTRIRLWDKTSKLQDLMKHHGQLTERVDHQGAIEIRWKGLGTPAIAVDAEITSGKAQEALPAGPDPNDDKDLPE